MDLFEQSLTTAPGTPAPGTSAPLAVRMRPKSLEQLVDQESLMTPGSALHRLLAGAHDAVSSVILWAGPGTGKTTIAYLIAGQGTHRFVELSAVEAGVKDVRAVIAAAKRLLAGSGKKTVLFIDEVHRFSKSQQDALLPAVENGWVVLIAATTENPAFSVISPLLSRSLVVTLNPLTAEGIKTVVRRAIEAPEGLGGAVDISAAAEETLVRLAGPDARRALTILEACAVSVREDERSVIEVEDVSHAADHRFLKYDKDDHYDVISAFIKSMRGSDPNAALHYLARMIEAGEDPRFIARRIMICAAEDVGLADPTALQLAVAAAQCVQLIGMPEGRIPLAEAAVAVALAPKSNAAYAGINQAISDVRKGVGGPVPPHLRDQHYPAARGGYKYPHDYPLGLVAQQYLPDDLAQADYYRPTAHGREAALAERLERIRKITEMR